MKKQKLQKLLVLACFVFVLQIILFPTDTKADAATAKISRTTITLVEGKSSTIKMTGISEKVKWASSNKTVATVSNGKIKALNAGEATINAKVGNRSYKCEVIVVPQFNKSDCEKSLRTSLVGRYIDVTVNGATQTFLLDDTDVLSFGIESATMNSSYDKVDVIANIAVDRTVAKVNVEATCQYTVSNNKWKLSSVTMKTNLTDMKIEGIWKGNYINGAGKIALELTIYKVTEDGYANAEFYFYAPPTNPKIPSGRYTMKGGIDFETGKIAFIGVEWIDNSAGWVMIDIDGQIDVANECISGNQYQLRVYPNAQ